jgi:hypothetical protein
MTYQEIVAEIGHLSIEERLRLIEQLARSVQADLAPSRRGSSLERLQGILKTDGPPPTDEDVREMITDYLIEKHS